MICAAGIQCRDLVSFSIVKVNESSDEEYERPAEVPAASLPTSKGVGDAESVERSGKVEVSKPRNAYEFGQVLNTICTEKDTEACAHLLALTAPRDLPVLLSNKLEGDMLLLLLQSLKSHLVAEDPSLVYEHLLYLSRAERFEVSSSSLGQPGAPGSVRVWPVLTGLSPFPDDPDTN